MVYIAQQLDGGSPPGTVVGFMTFAATAVNDDGKVCGCTSDGLPVVWQWGDPSPTFLELLGGDTNAVAGDVNASGVVCGSGFVAGDTSCGGGPSFRAYRWNGTSATELPPLGGHCGAGALGINDAGQIVGLSFTGTGSNWQAVIWNGTTPTALNHIGGGTAAQANGINEGQQVVGWDGSPLHAVGWDNGVSAVDLGVGVLYDINESGLAVGGSQVFTDITSPGSAEPLADFSLGAAVYGVSDGGLIAGQLGSTQSAYWPDKDADPINLAGLSGFDGAAFGISPNGVLIVGWSFDEDFVGQATLWGPINPGTPFVIEESFYEELGVE